MRAKKNLRIIRYDARLPERLAKEVRVRSALGGVLAEDDDPEAPAEEWRVVSQRQPTDGEWRDLALRLGRRSPRQEQWRGRRARCRDARDLRRPNEPGQRGSALRARGPAPRRSAASCASDGFFPFADGLEAAVDAGCSAIIAPGGSIRDADVIAAADRLGVALVFSTYRYFLH